MVPCSGVEGSPTQPTFGKIGKGAAFCREHKLDGNVDVRSGRCAHKACRHRGRSGGCTCRPCILSYGRCSTLLPSPGLPNEGCVVQPSAPEQCRTLCQM